MTVKELMDDLKNYTDDYRVILVASYDEGHCYTSGLLEEVDGDKDAVYLISNQE